MNSSRKARLREAVWGAGQVPQVPSVVKSEQSAISLIEKGEAALSEKVRHLKDHSIRVKGEARRLGAVEAAKRIKKFEERRRAKAVVERKELKRSVRKEVEASLGKNIEQLRASFQELRDLVGPLLVAGAKMEGQQ